MEIAEPPLEPTTAKPLIGRNHKGQARFNSENASAYGRLGALKRAENIRRAKELAALTPAAKQRLAVDYVQEELACVRRQIAKLNRKLMREGDPQAINWLSQALSRLREQERVLDGRPLPGQLRPSSKGNRGVTGQDTKTPIQPLDVGPAIETA